MPSSEATISNTGIRGDGRAAVTQAGTYAKRPVNQHRLKAIRDHAGRSVLDAGCGNGGYVLELLNEYDIRGIDIQPFDSWQAAPERFAVHNLEQLDLPPGSVDTVTAFEVLEHIPQPERMLASFHRICSKNVIITVPNCVTTPGMRASGLAYYHYTDPTHVNFFTLDSISELFRTVGFRSVNASYINRIDLWPFAREAFQLSASRLAAWLAARWLMPRQTSAYCMTCLVIGEK